MSDNFLSQAFLWFREHPLMVITLGVTLYLIYQYFLERGRGKNLSKKYRDSIFEAQSKIFLNASQHLISGKKDLAIKEFLNAVDLNRETEETYFALGKLFRSSGEIEKAISIHRSLIVREGISEDTRIRALKELAVDYDRGGFIDKSVQTYKDVLKVNRDQAEVIEALCRIFEMTEEWDEALSYRLMLSKVTHEDQSETISHILTQKAQNELNDKKYTQSHETLEDAFRFAPSVSAKILRLKTLLHMDSREELLSYFEEVLGEHPDYTSFIMEDLGRYADQMGEEFAIRENFNLLRDRLSQFDASQFEKAGSLFLAQVRLYKESHPEKALAALENWIALGHTSNQALDIETVSLLIDLGDKDRALEKVQGLLKRLKQSETKHYCSYCGHNSDEIFWRCPQCHRWETMQFRWKV